MSSELDVISEEPTFTLRQRVEFADTDMAGIMHFSKFFVLMERTEHAWFRDCGLSIHGTLEGQEVGWPRVSTSCDYRAPLRFEDEVDIELRVAEMRNKTLTYDFTFRLVESGGIAATGRIIAACVTLDRESDKLKAIAIPYAIKEKLGLN